MINIPELNKKPVFTQAMVDAGELPKVGMECQTSTGVIAVKYIGRNIIVSEMDDGKEYTTSKKAALHAWKPIDKRTDKEIWVDNKYEKLILANGKGDFKNELNNIYDELVGE